MCSLSFFCPRCGFDMGMAHSSWSRRPQEENLPECEQKMDYAYWAGDHVEAFEWARLVLQICPLSPMAWMVQGLAVGWATCGSGFRGEAVVQGFQSALECAPEVRGDSRFSPWLDEVVRLADACRERAARIQRGGGDWQAYEQAWGQAFSMLVQVWRLSRGWNMMHALLRWTAIVERGSEMWHVRVEVLRWFRRECRKAAVQRRAGSGRGI